MKRRGGGASATAEPPRSVATADVDDRQLSAEARQRAINKAASLASGQPCSAVGQPFPVGLMIAGAVMVALMLYLTVKFS